jgi:hypothetical protein
MDESDSILSVVFIRNLLDCTKENNESLSQGIRLTGKNLSLGALEYEIRLHTNSTLTF